MYSKPRPNVLAISFLFPNSRQPNYGIFVLNRLKAMSQYVNIKVINPVPWFPAGGMLARYRETAQIPARETIAGLDVYHPRFLSIPGFFKSVEAVTYRHAVLSVLKQPAFDFEFDLIDLHWTYPDLPVGEYLQQCYNKPMLCTLRGMEAFHRNDGRARSRMIDAGLQRADRLIALSQELKDTVDTITQQPQKSTVITNGVDSETFRYIPKAEARQRLGLPDATDMPIILGVGSLIHRKGFDMVIDALPQIVQTFPKVKYYVVGSEGPEGDYRKELKAKVAAKGLENVVVFQGAAPNRDLVNWYCAVDVFCLSSRGEGSPNVLSEALACGCPAVSTAVGSAPDIMAMANLRGFVVGADQPRQLAEKLIQALATHPDRALQASDYGRYNWDWCARKVLSVYDEVLCPSS